MTSLLKGLGIVLVLWLFITGSILYLWNIVIADDFTIDTLSFGQASAIAWLPIWAFVSYKMIQLWWDWDRS